MAFGQPIFRSLAITALVVGTSGITFSAQAADTVYSGPVIINMDVLRDLGNPPKPAIQNLGTVDKKAAPQLPANGAYPYVAPAPRQMTAEEAIALVPPPMAVPQDWRNSAPQPMPVENDPMEQVVPSDPFSFNSVTVLHSPEMEAQKAQTGKLELDDETWSFIRELRTLQRDPAAPQPTNKPAAQSSSAQPSAVSGGQPTAPDMTLVADAGGPIAPGATQGSVSFGPGEAVLTQAERQTILSVAAAHAQSGGVLQVVAYANEHNNTPVKARQLSLRRALVVRRELIAAGVPADAIDVRAQAAPASGYPDRVDIIRL